MIIISAGQEKYRSICMNHCRDAMGAILVFDLTRKITFANCISWLEDFRLAVGDSPKVLLVGNKLDIVNLDPTSRKVDRELAMKTAQENEMLYIETSAVTNQNVEQSFETLLFGKLLIY